jgi:hypothetical protein
MSERRDIRVRGRPWRRPAPRAAAALAMAALCALAWLLWPRSVAEAAAALAREAREAEARGDAGPRGVAGRLVPLLERAVGSARSLSALEAEATARLEAGRGGLDRMAAELDRALAEAGIEHEPAPPATVERRVSELSHESLLGRAEDVGRLLEEAREAMREAEAAAAEAPR